MTAKVLVVDDVDANIKLLRAILEAEYYDVIDASNGMDAIERAKSELPDIILLDVMMPGISGFETCERLKSAPETRHIPIILVTALDGRNDRLAGLEAGADDFLTKPVDDALLMARLKALVRIKSLVDELRHREASTLRAGLRDPDAYARLMSAQGNVLIVDDNIRYAERLMHQVGFEHRSAYETDPQAALKIASGRVDLLLLNMGATSFDPLRFVAQMRSNEATRLRPILGVISTEDRKTLLKGFELGVNDVIFKPVDHQELMARTRTQIKRKRYTDFLRQSLDRSLEMAVIDTLTGLHNRRYMESILAELMANYQHKHEPFSLLMLDIDYFKRVNDRYGHDAGDEVLKEFAKRVRQSVRAIDLPCRLGGEEFVVLMPSTLSDDAQGIAERVRTFVAQDPFNIGPAHPAIEVTVSVGVATSDKAGDTIETVLKRADEAVYEAKNAGRNRVIVRHAA